MTKKIKAIKLFVLSIVLTTIGCNNDDDQIATVNLQNLEVTIDENPADGETIGTLQTDGGDALNVSIASQTPSGALTIDSNSGELTVADASLFDYESNPTITATVTAENSENSASITINLSNVAEVSAQNLEVTIDENPVDGEVLGSLQTSGSASGFAISSQSPAGAMNIDSGTGELTVADASLFDFETNPTLTATVSIADAENPVIVTVNLNNVNEVTAQSLEVSLDENPTNGQVIGTLQTSGSASGFTITSQSPTGAIDIDSGTGELTVADAALFDYETNPTLTATVSIIDADDPVTVTVNLNNVIELTVQDVTVAIDENPTDGQVVGTIQGNGSGTISYSITTQSPMGSMAIDATTGELTVIDPNLFDYETNPVITATILADDGAETATATATINLNDIDEVTAQNTDLTIDENPSNGDVIGALQASGSNVTYTITFQNPAGAFNIDQNTGELSVADETLFDFETNPNMLATISVSNGTQTVSANAFVALNDVTEIGEYKYGGVIFWIDPTSNNSAGLVCALSDQGSNVSWGCQGTLIAGTSDSIGSGSSNTAAIVTGCSTTGIAAEIAVNATIEGFTDWFLPSRAELNEMYNNRVAINTMAVANGGTEFVADSSTRYWSSSESNNNTAWSILFVNGIEQGINKGASAFSKVRAIRAWTDF